MSVAVGVDVATVSRIAAVAERRARFLQRIYTPRERARCQGHPERLATRWAAKEAVKKLLGSLGEYPLPLYKEIEVVNRRGGAPTALVRGVDRGIALTLSHERDTAVAVAVLVLPEDPLGAPLAAPLQEGVTLPPRPDDGHKGTFGTVVVVAGASGFTGAAYLSSMGAARGGAGLIRVCVPAAVYPVLAARCVEVMAHPLPDGGRGTFGADSLDEVRREHMPRATTMVIGPGLGQREDTQAAVAELLESLTCPAVVDADGLNIAALRGVDWRRSGQPVVLTPHPAEMGRLAGVDTATVQSDREGTARRYAQRHGAVVVLKGAHTVVAAPDGRIHTDGHPGIVALASGGTGDVLAGLTGAFLAARMDAFDAAVAAVTVHAEAGAAVQRERGRAGSLAGDVLDALPAAQERVRRAVERRG
ncbi:MAG TPA: NAD(P)H-hydrate dehydratase [Candidatus Dormibacteraeota bacterium]|nr:NAD(P)H-hydrate dehydratase [Candidatus Dormibacteraeota bacterium]